MSKQVQNQYYPDSVSLPGETLLETLETIGMSQAELAERTGRAKKTINEIIRGKAPITPKIALEFERVLRIPAEFWNSRERYYQESLVRKQEQDRLKHHIEWLKSFPVKAMVAKGWVEPTKDKVQQVRGLLSFLGIASPDQWADLLSSLEGQIAFRKSNAFKSDLGALVVWLRKGELDAQNIPCAQFDANKFKEILLKVRNLTTEPPEIFGPEMIRLCARAGVAVVFVPELPKSRVSGATRWMSSRKALIQLSLRYKTNDHLWFTFFHEAGHILLHGKKVIFLEGSKEGGSLEDEANRFAGDYLIPDNNFRELKLLPRFNRTEIQAFAANIGVAPGIVVGRLQHEGLLPMDHCNDLKLRLEWANP